MRLLVPSHFDTFISVLQGIFYQCSSGHLFHLDCGLPYNDTKQVPPGCPHCGISSYRWKTANDSCVKVQVDMKCSNKRIFLPDQREQWYVRLEVMPAFSVGSCLSLIVLKETILFLCTYLYFYQY